MHVLALTSAFAILGSLSTFFVGCASDSSTSGAASGAGGQTLSTATGGSSGTNGNGGNDAGNGTGGQGGAREPDAGPTSKQCADYCDCYQTKCSVFVAIPTGQPCLDFCAPFTLSQYQCRFDMCFWNSNGPRENNNDHCQHTVGINECL